MSTRTAHAEARDTPEPIREPGTSAKMWTVRELALYMDVPEPTVRRWHATGRLPAAVKLGTELRWTDSDIVAALTAAVAPVAVRAQEKDNPIDPLVEYGLVRD